MKRFTEGIAIAKKKTKQVCLLLLLVSVHYYGKTQTEADIRKHYTEVNNQIEESLQQGYEGPLHQNQLIINKNSKSWPAIGRYNETADFWYNDDPAHISPQERNPKTVLLKVNVTRHSLHLRTTEEYLYKNGLLLFFYSNMEEEGNQWDVRVYYTNKGIALKTSVKENGKELTVKELATESLKDFKPNPVKIMAEGKKYQSLFIKTM